MSKTESFSIAISVWNVRRSPQRARRKSAILSRSSPKAAIEPAAGLTNPLRTLKNVVLPAPFGPMSPHVPPGKTTLMSSIGVTPAKRTVRPLTSITPPPFRRSGDRMRRTISRPRFAMSRGNCSARPPGAVRSTCSSPTPKMMRRKFELTSHCAWKRKGRSWLKTPATIAPQRLKMPPMSAVAASVRESCVWNVIARGVPTWEASRQPATPVMNDASANAHILYRVMFTPAASAAGSLSRIDAHARPGFAATWTSASRNMSAATTTMYR